MADEYQSERARLHGLNDDTYGSIVESDAERKDPVASETADSNSSQSIFALFRGMSWRKRLTLLTAAYVNFTSYCCFSMMAPFLPVEAVTKGIDDFTVGMIFASFELAVFIASPFLGRFISAIGARFMYIAGIFIAAVCTVLFGILEWCPPGWTFTVMAILCRLVEAIGCAMCDTASTAIVANEFPDHIGTVIGSLEAITGLGFMIGPTVGGTLYDLGGFFLPFLVVGSTFAAAGLVACFTLPSTAVTAHKDLNKLFKDFIKVPAVSIFALGTFVFAMMISFIDPLLSKQLIAIDPNLANSQTLIGLIFLISSALYALSSPLVGYLADTYDKDVLLLAVGNVGMLVSFLLLGPCPWLPIPPKLLWLTIVSLAVCGLACSFCVLPTFTIINRSCIEAGLPNDLDLYGLISGFFGSASTLGAFIGPLLGGLLVQNVGFEWSSTIMGLTPIIVLVALLLFTLISHKQKKGTGSTV